MNDTREPPSDRPNESYRNWNERKAEITGTWRVNPWTDETTWVDPRQRSFDFESPNA